jgi:hypothetical protein
MRDKVRIGSAANKSEALNIHDALLQLFADLLLIGAPDNTTVEHNAGLLRVKDNGIDNNKLKSDVSEDANRAVTTDHIRDLAVTLAKIADNAVDAAKLKSDAFTDGNRAVTTDHIRDLAVTTAKIAALAVTNAKIADKVIAAGKLNLDGGGNSESVPVCYPVRVGKHTGITTGATHVKSISALPGDVADYYVLAVPANTAFNKAMFSAELTALNEITYTFDATLSAGGDVHYFVFKDTV